MKQEKSSDIILSIVLPAYNEEEVIQETIKLIVGIMSKLNYKYEIIVVNDGSTDKTLLKCIELRKEIDFRILDSRINQGHMQALRAGMKSSFGTYVATLDSDLQDPPSEIPKMLEVLINSEADQQTEGVKNQKYDVVQAFRLNRDSDTIFKKKTATLYYFLTRKITGVELIPHAADFRIMNRRVVDTLVSLREQKIVFRLIIPALGFNVYSFPIKRDPRRAGKTKYNVKKMSALAIDSIISFSHKPLRILTYVGLGTSVIFFLGSFLTLFFSIFGNTMSGWPSLALLILSLNSFMFASVGVLGEYLGRIYSYLQNRPIPPWTEI